MMEQLESANNLKSHSCLPCRQRKVKCDRRAPSCSNCTRGGKQCSFIPPVRGKRKRTKVPKEGLHAKLRRYEELLRSYGANIDPSEVGGDDSELEAGSQLDFDMTEDTISAGRHDADSIAAAEKFVNKDGSSRFFDSAPWSGLGDDNNHPEDGENPESADGSNTSDSDLFLPLEPSLLPNISPRRIDLASFHPSMRVLTKMWDIYVDRADPLMKILHLPTFWKLLTAALQHPQRISNSLQALIFAFYLAIISSLEENECQSLLERPRFVAFSQYKSAARQALSDAGFLHTSSLSTLQAYCLFIVATRSYQKSDTLLALSGVAVRLARKIGLHRDGTSLGLPPFEAEMRRRLWWHIVLTDCRISDVLGMKPSADLFSSDTKTPRNVEDEDLTPDMVDVPMERNGITSIVICLIRCDILESIRRFSTPFGEDSQMGTNSDVLMRCDIRDSIRKFSTPFTGDARMDILTNSDIPLAKKDRMISQLEDHLERKYLRYCDPSNALHYFASIIARSSICKMKLYAHNPRRFANHGIQINQPERDLVFANATKLLEYVNLVRGNPIFDKYKWQIGANYLWNTILYVLIEARHRKTGVEVDRLWPLIGEVLSKCPQMFEKNGGSVYTTIGKWTLEAWGNYLVAEKAEGLPERPTPEWIHAIRRCQPLLRSPSMKSKVASKDEPDFTSSTMRTKFGFPEQDGDLSGDDAVASYDFSDLLSFETDSTEWLQWDAVQSFS